MSTINKSEWEKLLIFHFEYFFSTLQKTRNKYTATPCWQCVSHLSYYTLPPPIPQSVPMQAFARKTASYFQRRCLASISSSSSINTTTAGPFQVFDRRAKQLQKNRAAAREDGSRSRTVDYVRDEVADRMLERLLVSPYSLAWDSWSLCCSAGHQTKIPHYFGPWFWSWSSLQATRPCHYRKCHHDGFEWSDEYTNLYIPIAHNIMQNCCSNAIRIPNSRVFDSHSLHFNNWIFTQCMLRDSKQMRKSSSRQSRQIRKKQLSRV